MIIETFVSGPVSNNAYLVADQVGGKALFIDAPFGAGKPMLARARELLVTPIALVNTHGHWDHISENAWLMHEANVPLWAHEAEEPLLRSSDLQAKLFGLKFEIPPTQPTHHLADGERIELGKLSFQVLHLPGHTPGHIGLFESREKVLFCGDVLFAGSVGRTDLPDADWNTLLNSIKKKILTLGNDVTVYPGHGSPTTVGKERETNSFLQ